MNTRTWGSGGHGQAPPSLAAVSHGYIRWMGDAGMQNFNAYVSGSDLETPRLLLTEQVAPEVPRR
jgi:hypothetical protein